MGCRVRGGKAGLVRVVRLPEGRVEVDPTGKMAGRGAYVHPAASCIRLAIRRGALAHALRAPLGEAEAGRLVQELLRMAGDEQ